MDAVDGDASPPPELRLAWECERWRCLPDAGAYLDQDYRLITRMSSLTSVYTSYARYRNAKGSAIHNLSEADRLVLRRLKDMGVIFQA